jgi:DNA-binding transcriptional LysR family regulator
MLVVPVEHSLAGRDSVPLAELAGMSFIDGPRGYGNRTVVDDAFTAAGLDRTIALEVADVASTATYIRNGLGIGFLSESILESTGETGLTTLRIADVDLQWRLHVAALAIRPPSAAATALLSLIGNVSVA